MKLIADINIGVSIVVGLRGLGHDIDQADVFVPATAADAEIAALAEKMGAVVLTRDQDFSTLLAMSQANAPSVINLRHISVDAQLLIRVLDSVIRRHDADLNRGAIVTVDERGVRTHLLPVGSIS